MRKNIGDVCLNISRVLFLKKISLLNDIIWIYNRKIFSCKMFFVAKISQDLTFKNMDLSKVLHKNSIISNHWIIIHNLIIGKKISSNSRIINFKINRRHLIGFNVLICNKKILEALVIGNHLKINAGSKVLKDIRDNLDSVGNSENIIKKRELIR